MDPSPTSIFCGFFIYKPLKLNCYYYIRVLQTWMSVKRHQTCVLMDGVSTYLAVTGVNAPSQAQRLIQLAESVEVRIF